MKLNPIIDITNPPAGAVPATEAQLLALGVTQAELDAGEKRFVTAHFGPYQILTNIAAIVEDTEFGEHSFAKRKRFWGVRKCSNPHEAGHCQEGTISLGGKRRHVFTSSQLFELPDGRLIDVATLHLCNR